MEKPDVINSFKMKKFLGIVVLGLILVFSTTSCQSTKEKIKKIKETEFEKKPLKIEGPDKIVIKVCCD